MRPGRMLIAAFALAALVACGGGAGPSGPVASDAGGTSIDASIGSVQAGLSYTLQIWLPPGYAQGTATYPVIYAMDCEYRYATLVAALQQTHTEAILVNVCAMSSARRFVDFTMPGAASYYRFLTLELIPFVDARYRTARANRSLSGHSLSGQFVMYALYMEDPANRHFSSIVSEECTCWDDAAGVYSAQLAQPIAMEEAMYAADHRLPVNLVMAGDDLGNGPQVAALYATISGRGYVDLRSVHLSYRLGHVPMDGPAFAAALDFIYAAP
jgi:enterochelin esterase-like enzyme